MTKAQLMSLLNKEYGCNIVDRFRKLQEEFSELEEVYEQIENADMDKQILRELVYHFKDELADVNILIFHLAGILGINQNWLLHHAEKKIVGRKKNPNFMRFYPRKNNP